MARLNQLTVLAAAVLCTSTATADQVARLDLLSPRAEVHFGDLCVLKTNGTALLESNCQFAAAMSSEAKVMALEAEVLTLKTELATLRRLVYDLIGPLSPPTPPPPAPPAVPPPAPPPVVDISNCHAHKMAEPSAASGTYRIIGPSSFLVFCDMETDAGWGYAVVARYGAGIGCGTSDSTASCSTAANVASFTTAQVGDSTVIDPSVPNSEIQGAIKLSDAQIRQMITSGASHRFKWYANSDPNQYVYFELAGASSYSTTSAMSQRCTRTPNGSWSGFYTPGNDYGLTTRAYPSEPFGSYVVCQYTQPNCAGWSCSYSSTSGVTWADFMTTRHSTTYYDMCGRANICTNSRNVFLLLSGPPPVITSCRNYKVSMPSARSGVYRVADGSGGTFEVFCDMETDAGWGYAVVARYGAGIGCGTSDSTASCSTAANVASFTTAQVGDSTVIDPSVPNSEIQGAIKLSDAQIRQMITSGASHRFKWYANSDPNQYVYFELAGASSYSTTSAMSQRCTRTPNGSWSGFYTPGNDYGLTTRAYPSEPFGSYVVCQYTQPNCAGWSCSYSSTSGVTWADFMTTRHSTTYYDMCGRANICTNSRNVFLLAG